MHGKNEGPDEAGKDGAELPRQEIDEQTRQKVEENADQVETRRPESEDLLSEEKEGLLTQRAVGERRVEAYQHTCVLAQARKT
jgi:hypothetical protein